MASKFKWGDNSAARMPTKEYKDNFDKVFGKKKEVEEIPYKGVKIGEIPVIQGAVKTGKSQLIQG